MPTTLMTAMNNYISKFSMLGLWRLSFQATNFRAWPHFRRLCLRCLVAWSAAETGLTLNDKPARTFPWPAGSFAKPDSVGSALPGTLGRNLVAFVGCSG